MIEQLKLSSVTIVFLFPFYCLNNNAFADCVSILEQNIGWTIVESKTIEAWRDPGEDKEDGFEGCEYGRTIYFMDGTSATCSSYGYQYAYMPTAIILGQKNNYKGKSITSYKMIVEDDEYDIE